MVAVEHTDQAAQVEHRMACYWDAVPYRDGEVTFRDGVVTSRSQMHKQ